MTQIDIHTKNAPTTGTHEHTDNAVVNAPVRRACAIFMRCLTCAILVASGAAAQQPDSQQQLRLPWWDRAPVYTSGHYRIKSDLPPEDVRDFATHLDRTFESYLTRLQGLQQNLPTTFDVMIFKDRRDYKTTLSMRYGVNGEGSGGMFFRAPSGSALALWTGNLPRNRLYHVLQHEGFHQVAYALFGNNLPPWANEGLAEFFGEAIMVDGRLVTGLTNPRVLENIRSAIEKGEYIPFMRMLLMDSTAWNANVSNGSARLQYEQAWSMVHFLVFGENGRYADDFMIYLRHLNVGRNPEEAFVRAFGANTIDIFEQKWIDYASNQQPSAFSTAMIRAEFLAAGLLELSRRGQYPTDMESLKSALQEINFRYTIDSHSVSIDLDAADDSLFTIPSDSLTPEGKSPHFELKPTNIKFRNRQQRLWERDHPTPHTVSSVNLRPDNVYVLWTRDPESGALSFRITAR